MPTIQLGPELGGLYFEITNAIDHKAAVTPEEAQQAMEEGEVMRTLDQVDEIDLSLYDDEEREAINQLFQEHAKDRSKRLGYANNGLAYIAGVLVQIILHGEWENPETGEKITVNSLEHAR